MSTYAPTISNFYLVSTWKGYNEQTYPYEQWYSTASTGYADYSYSQSGIPAGAIIDSAVVTATLGSAYTGVDDCYISFDGVDYNFKSASLDITAKVQASQASGAVSFRYRFKANGGQGTTSVSGINHSSSLGFNDNVITITYHMPTSSFSLSTSSLEAGQTITVSISPADASYTHTVSFAFGSASQQYTGVATSQGFTVPLSWMNQIPNSTSGTASCTVQTYLNGTLMGTAPVQYFTIIVPASIKPTLTSLTPTLVSGYWNLYVQGKSQVTLTANGAAGAYGSTITGYSIAGGSTNPFTTGVLNTAGTNTFSATVTDSRGRVSDVVSCSITVTAYATPAITSVVVQRASNSSGTLADEGTYCKCTMSYSWSAIGSNARTTAIDYKETTSGTWIAGSTALIASGGYVVLGSGTTFAIDKSYDIRFTVDDSISNPVYAYAVLQTAKYIMDFKVGGNGVCFGGVATRSDAMEVSPLWGFFAGNITSSGNVSAGSISTSGSVTAGSMTTSGGVTAGSITVSSKSLLAYIRDLLYPVGTIYMSTSATNPGSIFGGTWARWGQGRVPVSVNEGEGEWYYAEQTGGEKYHTLSANEMPYHNHHFKAWSYQTSATTNSYYGANQNLANDNFDPSNDHIGYAGANYSHNNMQPYIACYMWKRTA